MHSIKLARVGLLHKYEKKRNSFADRVLNEEQYKDLILYDLLFV